MIMLNLTLWRQQLARHQQKKLKWLLGLTSVFSLLFILCIHIALAKKIAEIKRQSNQWQQTHAFTQSTPFDVMSLPDIQKAWQAQLVVKKIVAALFATTSLDTCFTTIQYADAIIHLTGMTPNVSDLVDFLKSWQGATVFPLLTINEIKQNNSIVQFKLIGKQDAI